MWGTPKTHERREVPLPLFLVAELADFVVGKPPDDLVFPGIRRLGPPMRVSTFRKSFDDAAQAIGVRGLHPHELRHTAASVAIASGTDVKVVQQILGHGSATMTLDTYGHLFEDRLYEVGNAMDAARTAAQRRRPTLQAATAVKGRTVPARASGRATPVGAQPLRLATSSVACGSTLCRSPTTPKSTSSKIGASSSLLTATMVFEVCIPARCWIAPEMPAATYS